MAVIFATITGSAQEEQKIEDYSEYLDGVLVTLREKNEMGGSVLIRNLDEGTVTVCINNKAGDNIRVIRISLKKMLSQTETTVRWGGTLEMWTKGKDDVVSTIGTRGMIMFCRQDSEDNQIDYVIRFKRDGIETKISLGVSPTADEFLRMKLMDIFG